MRKITVVMLGIFVFSSLSVNVCRGQEGEDMIEFESLKEAQDFGWGALPGAVLKMADESKIGDCALLVEPGPEPKEYMGIELTRKIDLTGAGPDDKLIMFVKQNFGQNICVNLRTVKGNVWRYPNTISGQWTRVEVDLDLSKWEQVEGYPVTAWPELTYLHIYSKGFDKEGEHMLIDGFCFFIGGKPAETAPAPVK